MARKILLADDSVTAQNMGRKILTDAGYDVITVNNGSAALKRVAEQKPDLIVLDVYMPGYSGLEVCVRLKDAQETARIPILLTVGKLEPFKPEEATRVRADGFIIKPFEASELLSALTRLEDRMVPSHAEGGRFGSSSPGIERFSGGDPSVNRSDGDDSGWKNRLRFPSKKKKEDAEPEPEPDFVTPSNFRDFRRTGGKPPAGASPFPLSTGPAAQSPVVVPDIPRDITPEELDALSELAAKLDRTPAPEKAATTSEKASPDVPTGQHAVRTEAPAPETIDQETIIQQTKIEAEAPSGPGEAKNEAEVAASTGSANAEAPETQLAAPSVETAPPSAEVVAVEASAVEPTVYKTEAAVAQEPAPIDQEDEPKFASVAEPVVAEAVEFRAETAASSEEPRIAEHEAAEEPATPSASHIPETIGPQGSSPSAEELAEALRFLTPSQPPSTLAEAGAALANELSRGAGSRWVAEAVALSPEEAAGSLEAEMFRTFAPADKEQAATSEQPAMSSVAVEPSVAVSEPVAEIKAEPPAPAESSVEEAAIGQLPAIEQAEAQVGEPQTLPAEETIEDPVGATTFADAVRDQEVASVTATAESASSEAAEAATHVHEGITSSEHDPGGEESMAKETKGKGGKSNWHQIRSGAPAPSDAVEAAKQSEETLKTMAAAAADGGSDASSIASIVDSVLADLRPKIVEEIARQLAKK